MAKSLPLESNLEEIFIKKAPVLPAGGKKFLVTWAPWVSLIIGALTVLSALSLWQWAHAVGNLGDYAKAICGGYGPAGVCDSVPTSRLSLWIWMALVFLLIEGVLYLLAFPGLRDHKKQGWDYLYYGAFVNLAYAVASLFTSYDVVGHFIGAAIGSAIGFYFLFQIRSAYTASKTPADK